MPTRQLFNHGSFTLHSGAISDFLINSAALTERDLAALAEWAAPKLRPFSSVYGIPRGGVRFAKALTPYAVEGSGGPRLVVDDVATTGASFHDVWEEGDIGLVIFNRGKPIPNVTALFQMNLSLR